MKRSGATILECTIALLMLSAAVAAVAQMLATVHWQQAQVTQREQARREAANALEQVMHRQVAWNDDQRSRLALSETGKRLLGDTATLDVQLGSHDDDGLQRIAVEVRWTPRGQPTRPVRLYGWRARPKEETP